ncbi:iron uptake transporter permease EfeU [Pseudoclavibacter soli]|uniref:iron uptake transporter permease EfeU n=1 Tax=Pseudoclavibacter soli TaxID=452623 RepID=UPI000408787F|nr:iron uptake transporter permease EfeU [Pseudoclavibacter soli]
MSIFVGTFLIGLREGLEAALVLGIIIAYLRKSQRDELVSKVWIGAVLAIVLSFGFGALLTWGPYGLTTQAQEALGGGLSILAVGLITWMIFWMAKTSVTIKHDIDEQVECSLQSSGRGLVFLAFISAGREGVETALFVWGLTGVGANALWGTIGAVIGILVAVVLGILIYRGFVSIDLGKFFLWTGVFLIIVAAGVLGYGVHDLQEASLLPGVNDVVFNIAHIFPNGAWYTVLLAGIFNFTPEPSVLQFWAWLLYLVITLPLFVWYQRNVQKRHQAARAARAAAAVSE